MSLEKRRCGHFQGRYFVMKGICVILLFAVATCKGILRFDDDCGSAIDPDVMRSNCTYTFPMLSFNSTYDAYLVNNYYGHFIAVKNITNDNTSCTDGSNYLLQCNKLDISIGADLHNTIKQDLCQFPGNYIAAVPSAFVDVAGVDCCSVTAIPVTKRVSRCMPYEGLFPDGDPRIFPVNQTIYGSHNSSRPYGRLIWDADTMIKEGEDPGCGLTIINIAEGGFVAVNILDPLYGIMIGDGTVDNYTVLFNSLDSQFGVPHRPPALISKTQAITLFIKDLELGQQFRLSYRFLPTDYEHTTDMTIPNTTVDCGAEYNMDNSWSMPHDIDIQVEHHDTPHECFWLIQWFTPFQIQIRIPSLNLVTSGLNLNSTNLDDLYDDWGVESFFEIWTQYVPGDVVPEDQGSGMYELNTKIANTNYKTNMTIIPPNLSPQTSMPEFLYMRLRSASPEVNYLKARVSLFLDKETYNGYPMQNLFCCDDNKCISSTLMCNGEWECSGGEDEFAEFCNVNPNQANGLNNCTFSSDACFDYDDENGIIAGKPCCASNTATCIDNGSICCSMVEGTLCISPDLPYIPATTTNKCGSMTCGAMAALIICLVAIVIVAVLLLRAYKPTAVKNALIKVGIKRQNYESLNG